MIGSGILNQPQVFYHAGVVGATISFIIAAVFIILGLAILIETGAHHDILDYASLAFHLYGRTGKLLVNIAIIVYTFGALLSYVTIIGGTSTLLVESWGCTQCDLYGWTVLMVVVFVLPLCLYKYYGHLGAVSVLSVVAIDSVVLLVIIGGPLEGVPGPVNMADPRGILSKIGSVVFALSCAPAAFHAYSAMKQQDMKSWRTVVVWSTCLGALMCAIMGIAGYLSFKDTTSGEILENFPGRYADFFKALMVAHLCLYIPVDFVVMRHSVVQVLGEESGTLPPVRHVLLTVFLLTLTTTIVLLMRHGGLDQGAAFGVILDFTGGIAGAFTTFVMPPAMFFKHATRDHPLYWPTVVMLVVGIFVMVTVPVISVLDAVQGKT
eukprot:CAMPEP_0182429474 /NCGR_PEP_ID=MMETSP1167-20130531/29469_1 /TAXON_ID=2988 /ORGANISM="Mallomonas Sp, Strain CCMP3275" /LENGTH=378 /DNA_ID=CAMNT_0024613205 /DNA_START=270 /DNA_END=1406 /DNA_ORIENTATION=-